jgi:hypothetical protein
MITVLSIIDQFTSIPTEKISSITNKLNQTLSNNFDKFDVASHSLLRKVTALFLMSNG